ncbi:hypothetical protein K440DRAFT_375336 [Wilcoxina mikolae CBS 423.85]|nr:hypothetical protein K440DRAFT_375336 [Wilcoxina mikolae CBS 423.85]
MEVTMSMVVERYIGSERAYECPRSDCRHMNVKDEDASGVKCRKCKLWFHVIEGNRIEDAEESCHDSDEKNEILESNQGRGKDKKREGKSSEDDELRHFRQIHLINRNISDAVRADKRYHNISYAVLAGKRDRRKRIRRGIYNLFHKKSSS